MVSLDSTSSVIVFPVNVLTKICILDAKYCGQNVEKKAGRERRERRCIDMQNVVFIYIKPDDSE